MWSAFRLFQAATGAIQPAVCLLYTYCRALSAAQSSDLVLVVGSSLMVWSAFRLVKAAKEAGAKLAIVNVGPTRADDMADIKVRWALVFIVAQNPSTPQTPSLAEP